MRRKSDMFKDFTDGDIAPFLPGEGEQAATTAALQTRERLAMVEEQLKSQFTSIAAYAQLSQHAVETARAESRADLDREKATILSLLERLREEALSAGPRTSAAPGTTPRGPRRPAWWACWRPTAGVSASRARRAGGCRCWAPTRSAWRRPRSPAARTCWT